MPKKKRTTDIVQQDFLSGTEPSQFNNDLPVVTASIPDESAKKEIDDETNFKLFVSIMALSELEGVGFKTICDAYDMNLLLDMWINPAIENHPFFEKYKQKNMKEFFTNKEKLLQKKYDELKENPSPFGFTSIGHRTYPDSLLRLPDPPRWLFTKGNIELLHNSAAIAVVGTREASVGGRKFAFRIASILAKYNVLVISGMAQGIDEMAHWGCLEYYGSTIGVLGHGISYFRLTSSVETISTTILNRDGLLISEYLPDDPPSTKTFLRRNSLIAAMVKVVIPVEFPSRKSGTGSTILNAKKMHTPVIGLFPQNTLDEAFITTKNNLIAEGAEIINLDGQNMEYNIMMALKTFIPEHRWSPEANSRQDRFFNSIIQRFSQVKDKIDLNENSIDRFMDLLEIELGRNIKSD